MLGLDGAVDGAISLAIQYSILSCYLHQAANVYSSYLRKHDSIMDQVLRTMTGMLLTVTGNMTGMLLTVTGNLYPTTPLSRFALICLILLIVNTAMKQILQFILHFVTSYRNPPTLCVLLAQQHSNCMHAATSLWSFKYISIIQATSVFTNRIITALQAIGGDASRFNRFGYTCIDKLIAAEVSRIRNSQVEDGNVSRGVDSHSERFDRVVFRIQPKHIFREIAYVRYQGNKDYEPVNRPNLLWLSCNRWL